ncbi:hypothetical protein EGW08_016812, partial [Elysia chlorotica]
PYKCRHCPRLFRHKKSRERHERLHSSDRKYKCHICGVGYSRSDHLRNHMRSHDLMANDEGYRCPVCQQNYMSASALTNHLKTHKTKSTKQSESPVLSREDSKDPASETMTREEAGPIVKMERFGCDECSEEFLSQEYLDIHTEETHRRGRNQKTNQLKCPLCLESFATTEDLCAHIVNHAPSAGTVPQSSFTLTPSEQR